MYRCYILVILIWSVVVENVTIEISPSKIDSIEMLDLCTNASRRKSLLQPAVVAGRKLSLPVGARMKTKSGFHLTGFTRKT